jgi:PTH1 family peptidyl-tRNA hydrolase
MVVDDLASRAGLLKGRELGDAWIGPVSLAGQQVLLVKPLTYMNRSGVAVERVLSEERGSPRDLIVAMDEAALPLDTLRIRERGSHGGHNGLRSVIDVLGTDEFPRLRIGVGPAGPVEDLADYVLSPFPPEEVLIVQELVGRAGDAVLSMLEDGTPAAMNKFNGARRS